MGIPIYRVGDETKAEIPDNELMVGDEIVCPILAYSRFGVFLGNGLASLYGKNIKVVLSCENGIWEALGLVDVIALNKIDNS